MTPTTLSCPDPVRAEALAVLVELEAHWEATLMTELEGVLANNLKNLLAKQNAFDAYHAKVVEYNGRFKPAYEAERLVNTPIRLRIWCRKMRDLFLQVEKNDRVRCPIHLLEKAYHRADRIGTRMNRGHIRRAPLPTKTSAAIRDLAAVADWCEGLATAPTSDAPAEAAVLAVAAVW